MKTYRNHTNGKEYLYAYDSIFIAPGRTVQKKKSLGAVDTIADVAVKKQEFALYLQREEARMRVQYWRKHVQSPAFTGYVSIEKLESHRTALFRAKNDMGEIASNAMETAFLVDFIYNSNKIEGSKVPRESVERQVRDPSKRVNDEVRNTVKAMQFVDDVFSFTPAAIVKLHRVLLAHEPALWGIRMEQVVVNEQHVLSWEQVKKELRSLCSWYERERKRMYPPELAFDFYYRFERIHPFIDGNGRTGRLIMNRILKDHRYHPMIVWNKRRQAHLTAFRKRSENKPQEFYKFMAEQFVKTHEVYLEKIEKAFNLEKLSSYFLQPSPYTAG